MKLPYREGTWFAVPLGGGGFATGLVARATVKGTVILCYFFGPRRASVPQLKEVESLTPGDAIRAFRIGDLALIRGEWPVIGHSEAWSRGDWPMPFFVRRDELSRSAWRVHYSDTDPNLVTREEPAAYENAALERNSVLGAGAVEAILARLLV